MDNEFAVVKLSEEERQRLLGMTKRGKVSARKLNRAHILLMANEGAFDADIVRALHVGKMTVRRTRERFVEGGLDNALNERPRPGGRHKLDGKQEAFLIALTCSNAPQGREHWTMQLLADKMVELKMVDELSDETVRRLLKKGTSNHG
jgi:transposase